ncbi:EspA/EspE family type VII secretion system effector [Mycobacterium hubeiense]|uniref:EspA/EspE family type VII secretion system effector n=1 Tax=Mycobacterium hubeiense TaxID=1867256 RepID=UPI000C7F2302|nr:EspA/EspE family type VII secretion system effector [Mycobacterium sp. QGD 101]
MGLLDDALDFIKRRAEDVLGVKWDKGPGILDKVSVLNEFIGMAGSPILAAAQTAIRGMKATTGSGEPEDGEAFKKSSDLLDEAADLVIAADPKSDRWDGTASETYGKQISLIDATSMALPTLTRRSKGSSATRPARLSAPARISMIS